MASLIEIAQSICDEVGIQRPTSTFFGNSTGTYRRLLAQLDRTGRDIVRTIDFTELTRLHQFTTVEDQEEYDLPSDFERLIAGTSWDEADQDPLIGPLSPQSWRYLKTSLLGSGVVDRRFRIFRSASGTDKVIYIDPVPGASDAGETLSFEYISKHFAKQEDGTLIDAFTKDSDVVLVNEDIFRLGAIVRWKRSTGLEFGSELAEYNNLVGQVAARTRPAPTLSMNSSRRRGGGRMGYHNIPETGYGA